MEQGWTINQIEETDFDVLQEVIGFKETKKEIPLEDFVKSI